MKYIFNRAAHIHHCQNANQTTKSKIRSEEWNKTKKHQAMKKIAYIMLLAGTTGLLVAHAQTNPVATSQPADLSNAPAMVAPANDMSSFAPATNAAVVATAPESTTNGAPVEST